MKIKNVKIALLAAAMAASVLGVTAAAISNETAVRSSGELDYSFTIPRGSTASSSGSKQNTYSTATVKTTEGSASSSCPIYWG